MTSVKNGVPPFGERDLQSRAGAMARNPVNRPEYISRLMLELWAPGNGDANRETRDHKHE